VLLKSKNVKVTGHLKIQKYDPVGQLIQELEVPNLVVTVGKEHIASRMVGTASASMSHMGVGSNSTSPVVSNTSLVSQLGRVELDDITVNGALIIYSATFGPTVATGSLTEAGIFNASTGGTMLCRTTFPVVTKQATETIAITWTVSIG